MQRIIREETTRKEKDGKGYERDIGIVKVILGKIGQ